MMTQFGIQSDLDGVLYQRSDGAMSCHEISKLEAK